MTHLVKVFKPQNVVSSQFCGGWPKLDRYVIDDAKSPRCGFYEITPAFAALILKDRNSSNRTMSLTKVAQICDDITAGRFVINGESIIFSDQGQLLDGQHRLQGCIETDTPIIALCALGISPDTKGTVDIGRARTPGDILQIDGVGNGTKVAAAARTLLAYHRNGGQTLGRPSAISTPMITDEVAKNPAIIEAVRWAGLHKQSLKGICSESDIAAARLILEPVYGDEAVYYLERVAIGDDIKQHDPAYAVRQRLANVRYSKGVTLEILMRGALAHIEGRTLTRITTDNRLPVLKTRAR